VTDVVKKSITVLVIGFAAFYLFSQPERAADAIQGAFDAVLNGIDQIIKFFTALAD
jgi:hypothetical protein